MMFTLASILILVLFFQELTAETQLTCFTFHRHGCLSRSSIARKGHTAPSRSLGGFYSTNTRTKMRTRHSAALAHYFEPRFSVWLRSVYRSHLSPSLDTTSDGFLQLVMSERQAHMHVAERDGQDNMTALRFVSIL